MLNTHACAHPYAFVHACVHACAHANTLHHIHTPHTHTTNIHNKRTHTHATHTQVHTLTHICKHMCIRTHADTCMQAQVHTYIHTEQVHPRKAHKSIFLGKQFNCRALLCDTLSAAALIACVANYLCHTRTIATSASHVRTRCSLFVQGHSSEFVFDRVFGADTSQEAVFNEVAQPLIQVPLTIASCLPLRGRSFQKHKRSKDQCVPSSDMLPLSCCLCSDLHLHAHSSSR